MAFTQLLHGEGYGKISFSSSKIDSLTSGFTHSPEIIKSVRSKIQNGGSWHEGDILAVSNAFYYISPNKEPRDIVLPSSPIPGDFVAIIYDTMSTIQFVSREAGWFPRFTIKSYKYKIMDLQESLVVDVPFHRLQLTFFDEQKGWLLS